jgi:tetratricopeptide (TPR) repeat protein
MMAEPATRYEGEVRGARQDIPAELGRFVVLNRVGAGGMGVVYAAYDPELDRKVAVKLLHPNLGGRDKEDVGRARLLREAQAMARLSHPNVVTVFDVGTREDQVFLAMEFVQGEPMADWLKVARGWQEVVAVFVAAGRGLAAAHREGIVHGDFKPDNVIVDVEGRARVLDFGLAFAQDRGARPPDPEDRKASRSGRSGVDLSTHLTRTGALTGTPPYVSPEQFLGASASASADQYAFCVSLHEGLYGQRPYQGRDLPTLRHAVLTATVPDEPRDRKVPAWLRRVVLRGLSRDPAQRFPDMPALLAELTRDHDRRLRRIGLAVLAGLALVGGALGYRWFLLRSHDEALGLCASAADNLVGVWDAERRAKVDAALRATGVAYAPDVAARVAARLDDYTGDWVQMHTDACQATHVRGEQSPALLDRRMGCLHRAHTDLRSLVEVLAGADASIVEYAADAVTQLPPLARCADTAALLAERPPPAPQEAFALERVREQLARARALERTMQLRPALAVAEPALAEARALGDRGLLAEAYLRHGGLLQLSGEVAAAEASLSEAFFVAESARHDVTAAEAAIDLVQGTMQQSAPGALQWARHAQAQIDRLEADGSGEARHLEANLQHALGTLYVHEGDHDKAQAAYERALEIRSSLPDADPLKIAALRNNYGNLLVRRGDLVGAQAQLDAASEIYRAELGHGHPSVAIALSNLGVVQLRRGQLEQALRSYSDAHMILVAGLGPQHPNVGVLVNNLGDVLQRQHQYAAAEDHYVRAMAIFTASFGADAPPLAYPLTGRGEALLALGRGAEALVDLERALTLRDAGSPTDLARTRFALARALWSDDEATQRRARGLAVLALDELRAADPTAPEVKDYQAWLAVHPEGPAPTGVGASLGRRAE